jgi:hypothetical protein
MIGHQQRGAKPKRTGKLSGANAITPKKNAKAFDGNDMTINPELDKFSGNAFEPEKYKEDEIRLAKSILPHSSPSHK